MFLVHMSVHGDVACVPERSFGSSDSKLAYQAIMSTTHMDEHHRGEIRITVPHGVIVLTSIGLCQ